MGLWQPTKEGYIQFLTDSKYVYETMEAIMLEARHPSCECAVLDHIWSFCPHCAGEQGWLGCLCLAAQEVSSLMFSCSGFCFMAQMLRFRTLDWNEQKPWRRT